MKARVLAIIVLAAAAPSAARAQEVTPDSPAETLPPDAPPPDTATPPAETAPAETAPAPAENPPPPVAPAPPPAAAAPTFGAEGQLLLSIDLPFMNEGPQFAIVHESSTMGVPSSTRIVVQPSVDTFIAPSVSLGAQLGVDHLSIDIPPPPPNALGVNAVNGGTTISIEARVGYDIPLADTVSIWPRLGIGYTYTRTTYVYTSAVSGYAIPLSLTVPFLWHPGSHFFVGAGPAFVTQVANQSAGVSGPKTTDYGITALIGGATGSR